MSKAGRHPRSGPDWMHLLILGGMSASLATAIVSGVKKWRGAHIASSLCFGGFALTHAFVHQWALSHRVRKALEPSPESPRPEEGRE